MAERPNVDLARVDLTMLAEALQDQSYERSWWFDPSTGQVEMWMDELAGEFDDGSPEDRQLIRIEPIPSREWYLDMADFIERVRDERAADLLARAIDGRGAFRRFRDTLHQFPVVREEWLAFSNRQAERRAIAWLEDEGLVEEATARAALAAREHPPAPGREPAGAEDQGPPPGTVVASAQRLLEVASAYWASRAVHAAARLGIADVLAAGPLDHAELAARTGTDPQATLRLLRALTAVEVVRELADGRFDLGPLGEHLVSGTPRSMRSFVLYLGGESYTAFGEILRTIERGGPAFEHALGLPFFDYLARHPEAGTAFDLAMDERQAVLDPGIAELFDFGAVGDLVDVGGGRGHVLRAILTANPRLHGTLFDRPEVVERARAQLGEPGLSGRCRLVGGDFFDSVPAGGDCYLLASVLHDWDDERAGRILRNCRAAMGQTGRLLIAEVLAPDGPGAVYPRLLDLHILVTIGGRLRREADYRSLLAETGFSLTQVVPARSRVSVIEARPV